MSLRHTRFFPRPALFCMSAALMLASAPLRTQTVKNEAFGFQVKTPKDFRQTPTNLGKPYVLAKLLYRRPLETRSGYAERIPSITVLVFPKKGTKAGDELAKLVANPYPDYESYAKKTYEKARLEQLEKSFGKLGGRRMTYTKTRAVETVLEEPAITSHLHVWAIDLDDSTYVIELRVLADWERKLAPTIKKARKWFKLVPRRRFQELKPPIAAPSDEQLRAATPEGRLALRSAQVERVQQRALASLPASWKSLSAGPFLLVYDSEAEARYARKLGKHVELLWNWLNAEVGHIGVDQPVAGVVRLFDSRDDSIAYQGSRTADAYARSTREIVLYKDRDSGYDKVSGRLASALVDLFLDDKDRLLLPALPPWLHYGYARYIRSSVLRRGKIELRVGEYDMEDIRAAARDGFAPSKQVLATPWGPPKKMDTHAAQALAITHFLMTDGRKNPTYEKLIPSCLRELEKRLAKVDAAWRDEILIELGIKHDPKPKPEVPTDPEERAAYIKKLAEQREAWQKKYDAWRNSLYAPVFESVFGAWTADDWEQLDDACRKLFRR